MRNNLTGLLWWDSHTAARVCGGLNEKKGLRPQKKHALPRMPAASLSFIYVWCPTAPQTWPMTFAKIETNRRWADENPHFLFPLGPRYCHTSADNFSNTTYPSIWARVIYSCGWRKRVGAAAKQRRKHTLKGGLFKGLGSCKKCRRPTTAKPHTH